MPSTSIANLPLVSILLLSHSSSAIIGDPTELLSKATSVQISPNDTWSCVPPSSPGSLSCAFDGNSSTRWTLNPGQRAAMITVDLDPGVIIDHFEVSFDESSVNPSFVVMTLFGNDVTWTTYMYNKSCQSCERRLRKSGSLYYSCTPAGSFWNVSVPLGLFSVRNGSDGWLWWRTFNRLQLAIQANDADYINQTKNSSIAIADIGLYGWNQPMNVCYYCYPADVVNASVLCHSNGTCQCKPGIDPDQCFPLSHHINSTIPECDASDTATCCPIGLHVAELNISMDIDNNCKNGQFADNTSVIFLNMNFQITAWKEDPMIYNVYNGRKSFQVQGSDFTKFISKEDYRVTVGDVQCEITSVSKNVIVFYPPNSSNFVTVNDPKKTILYVGCSAYVFPVGYIQYYLNWIDNPVNRNGLIIGLVCGVGGVIIIILAIVPYRAYMYCKSKRASPPGPSRMIPYHLQEARCSTSRGPQRDPSLLDGLSSEQKLMVEEVVVPYSRIQLVDEIGSGNFGKVYRGLFFKTKDDTEEVAIKTILTDSFVEWQEKVSFLQEAMLMKDLSHRNVLSLVAVVIENNFLYVVLPLMENGDLRGFVSKPEKHFSVLDLTSYSLQIAEGMEYLAENKFVHRDLAARNCMINKSFVVKVADFGLARDIFEKDYYRPTDANRPLPVKWMPIECLAHEAKFTECSDVWSFGVLMWELFTRGRKPYADIDNNDMKRYLMRGDRLEQPRCTPDFMYDLMRGCWKETPTERPRFKEIVTSLREILHHAPENSRTSVTYVGSADETADADQLRLYIRRDGPVSYIDLSQHVPVAYLELPQVDVDSSLDETQGDLGSNPKLTQDNRGSNPKQTHYDRVI